MPKASTADDITDDGIANSTVPRRSFCISSLSPPSWLEPKTTTLALLPSFSLARRANSLADSSNSEPGPPTWPSLSLHLRGGGQRERGQQGADEARRVRRVFMVMSPWCGDRGCRMCSKVIHRGLHAAAGELDAAELQSHLDAGQRGHQRQVVAVAEVADAEHAALDAAQAGAQRQVEALVDQLAQRVGVDALGRDHAGQHRREHGRVGALDRQPPGLHRAAHRLAPAPVAREDRVQPLAEDHVQRLVQAVEQVGARRVGPVAALVHLDDLVPGPEGLGQLGGLARLERLGRQRVEADARRQHQALLRAADRDVDAPFVVPVVGAGQAGDGVDHQQRRVAGVVDRAAHRGDVAGHAGGGLVVHHAHGLQAVLAVGAQALADRFGVDAVAPGQRQAGVRAGAGPGQELGRQAQALGHLLPQRREVAGLDHQHRVARAEAR